MKKIACFIFLCLLLFFPSTVGAQSSNVNLDDYVITDFQSEVVVEKDTTLFITETIKVNFPDDRHGIYRVIPVIYSPSGKTLNSRLSVVSVTDGAGRRLKYESERRGQSVSLKIGDADVLVTGAQTYVIKYKVQRVLQRYDTHDELYWNVTGSEWDTDIRKADAVVHSPYAKITKIDCFAGLVGTTSGGCTSYFDESSASFASSKMLGYGQDFTIVVGLDKESGLVFPGKLKSLGLSFLDNWAYLLSPIPFLIFFYLWYKRGRDQKYAGDNVYFKPTDGKVITKPLFAREHLPLIYHPIQGFTPSQVGTIVDEKVDIHDVVSEITELARLGFLKIEKVEKKKLLGKTSDFVFTKLDKETKGLEQFQVYLLEKLFDNEWIASTVLLSSLKNHFYEHLEGFRKKLYDSLDIEGIFDGKPDKVRQKWIGIYVLAEIADGFILVNFSNVTANFFPLILFVLLSLPAFFFAFSMPRRTPWGYSLYSQIKGLAFYLSKGKWREEIAEKHLFFEEMLPLAIALGIVDKLAKDMQDLGVSAPQYIGGVTAGSLSNDISSFRASAASTLVSAPGGKGYSSWSGGSGFSGGSSGGGFGGGGGGSW